MITDSAAQDFSSGPSVACPAPGGSGGNFGGFAFDGLGEDVGDVAAPFPRVPWAVVLTDKPFPGRPAKGNPTDSPPKDLGGWFWGSGFDKDPINDIERIRDLNIRAMYGA